MLQIAGQILQVRFLAIHHPLQIHDVRKTTALHHIKMTFCKERYMKNNRMHGGSVRIMQASHKCKIMEEQCRLYLTEHS